MKMGPELEAQERVKKIAAQASDVVVDPKIDVTKYIRSGREMIRSASNYQEDGNIEHAYVLYLRFLTIFLNKLRDNHPGFKDLPAADKKLMKTYCGDVLPKAETLRLELLKKYKAEHEQFVKDLEKRNAEADAHRKQKEMEAELARNRQNSSSSSGSSSVPVSWNIPKGRNLDDEGTNSYKWTSSWPYVTSDTEGPINPAKLVAGAAVSDLLPSAPLLSNDYGYNQVIERNADGSVASHSNTPQFDRNMKPNRFLSPMSSGLRQVVVPTDLSAVFLLLADKNTKMNVEMCGFLTGKIMNGKLVVTDLIIPRQEGTSDSCTTCHEEEYYMIQDKFDLITFGWIHTHPSQTAFLSSVDLHTHYSYQSMMPEAIAIVCAPSKKQTGVYTLTPEGMDLIGNCRLTGFHPHSNTYGSTIFTDASHHTFDQSKTVKVHDLRK